MAKKETTKKTTKKSTKKKIVEEAPIEVQEFEEAAALEVTEEAEPENVDVTEIEVMNGDPAVVIPTEEVEAQEEEAPAEEEAAPEVDEPAPVEEAALREEIKPKKDGFRRTFGFIWNGQEMDY